MKKSLFQLLKEHQELIKKYNEIVSGCLRMVPYKEEK